MVSGLCSGMNHLEESKWAVVVPVRSVRGRGVDPDKDLKYQWPSLIIIKNPDFTNSHLLVVFPVDREGGISYDNWF